MAAYSDGCPRCLLRGNPPVTSEQTGRDSMRCDRDLLEEGLGYPVQEADDDEVRALQVALDAVTFAATTRPACTRITRAHGMLPAGTGVEFSEVRRTIMGTVREATDR